MGTSYKMLVSGTVRIYYNKKQMEANRQYLESLGYEPVILIGGFSSIGMFNAID